jgi:tRNA threonylcarbamoyl adenosine modification protein YeaZ
MIVLALDGALRSFSTAIARDREILSEREIDQRSALEGGLGCIAAAMSASNVCGKDVDVIAVGVGPGSFTGMRIAISYAKSIAIAWRVPIVPISSYDLLEGAAPPERALAVVATRRGIVCARFREAAASERSCGEPQDVLARIVPSSITTVPVFGAAEDVADVLAERAIHVNRMTSNALPAATAALIAQKRPPASSPHAVTPEYGELPAARVPRLR